MPERKSHLITDKGPGHAILIALFDGRKAGRVVTVDQLKVAVAEEYEDNHVLISDEVIYFYVSRLRNFFQEHAPDYKIKNRINIGYDLVKDAEIRESSLAS